MLANVDSDLLALVSMGIHQDPLDQVVPVLISSNVDERDAGTIWTSSGDDTQILIQELVAANLQAFLNNLGRELINAVVVRVVEDVVDNAALVWRRTVLAEVLDTPVAELTMRNEINVGDDLFDGRALLLFNAVLEDVLNNETAGLAKSNLMPHATKSLVDLEHDLRRFATPAELEQLLPDMTSIAVDDSIWDASKQLTDHVSFVVLRHRVESLLDDMTAEWVHTQGDDIAMNGIGDSNDLVWSAVLEASLNKEIAEAIDHERVCLADDGFDDLVLLLCGADLELLLQEDGCLLVIVADDFIDNIFPITRDSFVQKTAVVHRLKWRDIGLAAGVLNPG